MKARVEALDAGASGGPVSGASLAGELVDAATQPLQAIYRRLEERVADMEAEKPRSETGRGVRLDAKTSEKSVVVSKLVANIGPLTDEKDAFRQWDEKMVNALTHLRKGYGPALASIKDIVDRGRDPEDARRGMSTDQVGSVSGPTLADTIRVGNRAGNWDVDMTSSTQT